MIRRPTDHEVATLWRERAFSRRPGANRRGLRGIGGGARTVTINALQSWTTSNYYILTGGNGPKTPRTFGVLFVRTAAANDFYFTSHSSGTLSRGWALRVSSNSLQSVIANGSGAAIASPAGTGMDGVGVVQALTGTYDGFAGAGTLRAYKNKTQIGTGTATTGYTSPTTDNFTVGIFSTANFPAANIAILGAAFSNTTLSAAQIATWLDACKSAGKVVDMTDALLTYDVTTSATSVPATWSPTTGAGNLTKTGTPTLYTAVNPTWGW